MKKNYFLTLLFTLFTIGFSFGQVFITELADPNDNADARYIELYNAGASPVDLNNWRIDKYTNASATVSQSLTLTGTIAAGGFYIIATGPEDTVIFDIWGVTPDQWDPAVNHVAGSNGDDNLELYNDSGTLIDQFGVPGVDGTNQDHEFEDGRAERKPTVTSGNPVWDFNEWNIDNDGGDGDGAIDTTTPNGFDPGAWIGTVTTPIVSATGSVAQLTYFEGSGPSTEDSFSVSGTNLTADLIVTAPTNFEVSLTSGSGFAASVNITPTTGTVASTDIYVRLKAGLAVNTYNGDVTVSSTGATNQTVALTGEVEPATPQFNVSAFLDPFNYIQTNGGPSPEDSFTVSGDNLTADIVITAPTNFEVSLTSGSSFAGSVNITPTAGSVAFTNVYVRLKSGLTEGSYSGDITVSSTGVTDETIAISGNVYGAPTNNLIIIGVYDGPLPGGIPKGIELYVVNDIPDLSKFGVSSVTNGAGSTNGNVEFTFPADAVTAGTFIYVATEATEFNNFFGISPDYTTSVVGINGDDAIELYENGQIIDVFGDVDTDGTGEAWDYEDGWAYRKDGTGPEGTTFTVSNWTYSGANALNGETTNLSAVTPFPRGTYLETASILPAITITSPANNATLPPSTLQVQVVLDIANFILSADAGGGVSDNSGDGYIKTTIEETGEPNSEKIFFTSTPDPINVTPGKTYTVTVELVDNSGSSLSPVTSASITFTIDPITQVATLADLRAGTIGDYYELTGEAFLTYNVGNSRNQRYIQDATAAILIDDNAGIITTSYNVGDGISGIKGQLGEYGGVLQFIPLADPGAASSSGNTVTAQVVIITELNNNLDNYESELITINDVNFTDADGSAVFALSQNYTIQDLGTNTLVFRTAFDNADFIGNVIPSSSANITGIAAEFNGTSQIFATSSGDIVLGTNRNEIEGFAAYPNPIRNNRLTVKTNSTDRKVVSIFNVLGRKVYTANFSDLSNTLDIGNLASGIYILKVTENNKTVTRKLVKQ